MRARRGMVLGKFLPPHAGHVYLIDFAKQLVDELTVVVGTLPGEPIAGELRYRWMTELAPGARVVHLTEALPQDPSEHPAFWELWRASLSRILGASPDLVFASEPYGERLARELGARFVPVDPSRAAMPTSGTAVRADPLGHWRFLPPCVRAHYAIRVCVVGPESTGKSTLAARLAARFKTQLVPEYARGYLELRDRAPVEDDMPVIAIGQVGSEDALARHCDRLLVCDTDALTTRLWSEALFQRCDPEVAKLAAERSYALTLVTDAEVPFVPDAVRYLPEQRPAFFARTIEELTRLGRRFEILRGGWDDRFDHACRVIESLHA